MRTRNFKNKKDFMRFHGESPLTGIFVGVAMIIGAYFLYEYLSAYQENNGDSVLDWIVPFINRIKGNYILPAIIVFVSLYNIYFSAMDLKNGTSDVIDEKDEEEGEPA